MLSDCLSRFKTILDDYEKVQLKIDDLTDDDETVAVNYLDRKEFDDKYFNLLAIAKTKYRVLFMNIKQNLSTLMKIDLSIMLKIDLSIVQNFLTTLKKSKITSNIIASIFW